MKRISPAIVLIVTVIFIVTFITLAYAAGDLPKEFQGKWVEYEKQVTGSNKTKSNPGDGEFLINNNSIIWKEKKQENKIIKVNQVTVAANGQKIKFNTEEIAAWNLENPGKNVMRPINVELMLEGGNLIALISAGDTKIPGKGLVVISAPTKIIYKRN